jgi:hypothetical protein
MIHLPTESRGAQRALVRFFSVACERTNLATFEGERVGTSSRGLLLLAVGGMLPAPGKLPRYIERGSTNHLDRSTEKSSVCAIAPGLREQNILEHERYVAQTRDDVGWREII